MRLRNKKTGEIGRLYFDHQLIDPKTGTYAIVIQHRDKLGYEAFANYFTLAELNKEWEDYEPAESLIKNEKIRKAIRAWLSIQEQPIKSVSVMCVKDHDGFFCYHLYGYIDEARIVDGKAVVNKNLTSIDFEFRSKEGVKYDERRDYTIAELCGEEEAPEPLEPNFIDLDERIKGKAAAEKLYRGENDMHLTEEEE